MPISWFDKPDNNCGILSKRLGTDCQTINGMATTYIYIMIQSLATLITGLIIALIYEWRIALVALGFMPLVMLAGAVRSAFRNGLSKKEDEAYK
jgi:ATP-binding cassette subfamily B (MDR/TAP) protein 1